MHSLSDHDFHRFQRFIHDAAGISLSPTKKSLVSGRLSKRLSARGMDSFHDYLALLAQREERAGQLSQLAHLAAAIVGSGPRRERQVLNRLLIERGPRQFCGRRNDLGRRGAGIHQRESKLRIHRQRQTAPNLLAARLVRLDSRQRIIGVIAPKLSRQRSVGQ